MIKISTKIDQAKWKAAKQTIADRLAKSEADFNTPEWSLVHGEYLDLEKGIKEIATAGLIGAAAMAPGAQTAKADAQPAPKVSVAKPAIPSKIDLNEDLKHIAEIESSGGKNKKHEMTNVGLNKGHTAGGATGLMPLMVQETVQHNPDLRAKYGHLLNMTHDKVTAAINNDEHMENDIANHHWARLGKTFGGDKARMAYAWRNGVTAAKTAEPDDIAKHPYVQKFMKNYSREVASIEKSELAKIMTMGHAPGGGAVGGAALIRESLDGSSAMKNVSGKIKKKIGKKKLAKAIDELDEMEALVKFVSPAQPDVKSKLSKAIKRNKKS